MEKYIIGIDVGGTKVAYGLFDCEHSLLETVRHPSDKGLSAADFTDKLAESTAALLKKHSADTRNLAGVGVCLPSFVDYRNGYVAFTANLPLLADFAIRDHLEGRLGVPVEVDNDCNAAALAEHRYGAGKGCENMLYVAISTGLGLGIIVNGRLFRGDNGWAGESGHMLASPELPDDFESHISGVHITRRLAEKLRAGEKSSLAKLCEGDYDSLTAEQLLQAYRQGDPLAQWGVEHMARYLGVWTYNLYLTLNIGRFVFGGGLVSFGDALIGGAHREMMSHIAKRKGFEGSKIEFSTAQLGNNFGIIGAAELVAGK